MEVDLVAMSTALDGFLPRTRRFEQHSHSSRNARSTHYNDREENYETPPQRLFDASTFLSSSSHQNTVSRPTASAQQSLWSSQASAGAHDIQWNDPDSSRFGRQETVGGENDSPQPVRPSARRSSSFRSYTSSALSPSPSMSGPGDHSRRRHRDANQTELIAPRERVLASQSVERGWGRTVTVRGLRRAVPPLPSQPLLDCQVAEASGQGARNVVVSGSAFRPSDQIWSTNTLQAASGGPRGGNPVFLTVQLLQSKQYVKKEIVSHTPPTATSPGERYERYQDIAILLYLDSASRRADEDVSQVTVACSQHPKTGFVNVVRSRKWSACDSNGSAIDIEDVEELSNEQPVFVYTCIVLPGTLVAPFIRVSLTPSSRQVRVVRVSLVACAQASTWTERRVAEEPLSRSEEPASFRTLHDEVDALLVDMDRLGMQEENALQKQKDEKAAPPSGTSKRPGTARENVESAPSQRRGAPDADTGRGVSARETLDSNVDDSDDYDDDDTTEVPIAQQKNASSDRDALRMPVEKRSTVAKAPRDLASRPPHQATAPSQQEAVHQDSSDILDGSAIRSKIAMHARQRCLEVLKETTLLRKIQENPASMGNAANQIQQTNPLPATGSNPRSSSSGAADTLTATVASKQTAAKDSVARTAQYLVSTWGETPMVPLDHALVHAFSEAPDFSICTASSVEEAVAASQRSIRCHVVVVARSGSGRGSNTEVEQDLLRSFVKAVEGSGVVQLVMRTDRGCCCRVWSSHLHTSSPRSMRYYFLIDGGSVKSAGASNRFADADTEAHINAAASILRDVVALARRVAEDCEAEFVRRTLLQDSSDSSGSRRPYPPVLKSFLDLTGVGFVAVFPLLRPWLVPAGRAIEYYSPLGGMRPSSSAPLPTHLLALFLDGSTGKIPPTCWFGMILTGSLVHVADTSNTDECVPYLHIRLHVHVQSYAVWQPRGNATRVVLANAHVLQHIHQLDGVVASPYMAAVIACANGGGQRESSQTGAAGHTPPVLTLDSSDGARRAVDESAAGYTDRVTFRALGEAYRRGWSVVGCALNFDSSSFDENVFLDTVYRWGYNRPRVLVLFYCAGVNPNAAALVGQSEGHSTSWESALFETIPGFAESFPIDNGPGELISEGTRSNFVFVDTLTDAIEE